MTAMELRAELLQKIATIIEDDELVQKTVNYLQKAIKTKSRQKEESRPRTKEEILLGIGDALKEIKAANEGKNI